MPGFRIISLVFMLGLMAGPGLPSPAGAADEASPACLNRAEQRSAVASQKAVPLSAAIKSLRQRGQRGEIVRAALCNRGDKLVYELTLLARNGKVTRSTVDAANGEPMTGP